MSESATWACTLSMLSPEGQPAGALTEPITVGQKFLLGCEGEQVSLDADKIYLEIPQDQQYALKLLSRQEVKSHKLSFVATSYTVGKQDLTKISVSDGTHSVKLSGIQFEVRTVIDPKTNPKNEMIGPFSVIALSWPVWVWMTLAIVAGVVLVVVGNWIRRSVNRKKWLKELAGHNSALSPYNQFNKEMRVLGRKYPQVAGQTWDDKTSREFITELDRSFRWYLSRELQVPALHFSTTQILRDLRKHHRSIFKVVAKDLRLLLSELQKALSSRVGLKPEDALQLADSARRVADNLNRERLRIGKPKGVAV